jgi:hypothetical protein
MKNDAVSTGMHNRVVAKDRYVARRTNPLFTRETTGIETEEGLGATATATATVTAAATATTGAGFNNGEGDASVHDIDVAGIHDIGDVQEVHDITDGDVS